MNNKKVLNNFIKSQKVRLLDSCYKSNDLSKANNIITAHIRELLIVNTLNMVNTSYKNVDYRFLDNNHIIEINKNNTIHKYCIKDSLITQNTILNNEFVRYEGYKIIDDFFNNTKVIEDINMNIAI